MIRERTNVQPNSNPKEASAIKYIRFKLCTLKIITFLSLSLSMTIFPGTLLVLFHDFMYIISPDCILKYLRVIRRDYVMLCYVMLCYCPSTCAHCASKTS